ncbi:MAG: LytTR family DNA-binding domain-containing protein [Bacteroidetes bacterium]|nr:LytTR family DNA-binding domain-containing protein [Bacteroidota bacterium]
MIRILIIDDETNIRTMIAGLIQDYCKSATVIGQAASVSEGVEKIQLLHPDLVLLDVKMSDGTGFDLLNKINSIDFKVIFITAHEEFAMKAIKFSALDYILKPVDPDELIRAIDNAAKEMEVSQETQLHHLKEFVKPASKSEKKILLKTLESMHVVSLNQICCGEGEGGYTRFHIQNGKCILVSKTLGEYEELLLDYGFFRVHRSFLVNLEKVQSFEREDGGYLIMDGDLKVPVASRKREHLLKLLEKLTE